MSHYIDLAKSAVENYVENGKIISPPLDLPKDFLTKRSGAFVTIEKSGELRGCIGTYMPVQDNIAQEIINNAISAATEDYRFGPIAKEELPYLSYTVYILHEPELAKNIKELDPKKYGVLVKTVPLSASADVVFNGHFAAKSGLLLPDLEDVNTVEEQISIACQKAGIDPDKENMIIYRFTVEKYGK